MPLLDIGPKGLSSHSSDTWSALIIAAHSTIGRKWKQLKCPSTDEWVMKMWDVAYTLQKEK